MLQIGDRFRVRTHPETIYTMRAEHVWQGRRHIIGYYRHGLSQLIGCDLPEDELDPVDEREG